MRRHECDSAVWSWFRWDKNVIEITPHKYFAAKTKGSAATIPVDPVVMKKFWDFYVAGANPELVPVANGLHTADFVIKSAAHAKGRVSKTYHRTRTEQVFRRLTDWLRASGVDTRRAFHELRKESGSLVNAKAGIHAASRHLRHASIVITSNIYSDNRAATPVQLSDL